MFEERRNARVDVDVDVDGPVCVGAVVIQLGVLAVGFIPGSFFGSTDEAQSIRVPEIHLQHTSGSLDIVSAGIIEVFFSTIPSTVSGEHGAGVTALHYRTPSHSRTYDTDPPPPIYVRYFDSLIDPPIHRSAD